MFVCIPLTTHIAVICSLICCGSYTVRIHVHDMTRTTPCQTYSRLGILKLLWLRPLQITSIDSHPRQQSISDIHYNACIHTVALWCIIDHWVGRPSLTSIRRGRMGRKRKRKKILQPLKIISRPLWDRDPLSGLIPTHNKTRNPKLP